MYILYPFPEPLPLEKARGVQVVNITHALAGQGNRVDLLHTGQDQDVLFRHYGLEPTPGFNPATLSRSISLPGLTLKSNKIYNYRLSRYIDGLDGKPDLIISRHLKTAYHLLRHHAAIPLLYDAHEVFPESSTNPKNRKRLKAMESYVLSKATYVTAISENLAQDLKEYYGIDRDIDIVRTATQVPKTMPEKDWSQPGRHIIYTGSLYGWKGVDDIIAAGRLLEDTCHITIIGGDAEQIAALKTQLGDHADKFEFHPFMPHEGIRDHLAKACIALLPNNPGSVSQWTSPLKLYEYLANGCAILASDIPSIREIIGTEEAVFYNSGQYEEMASSIKKLSENPETTRMMGLHNHQLSKQHSWEARAGQILRLTAHADQ